MTATPTLVLVPVLSRSQTRSQTSAAARAVRATAVAHNPEEKLEEAIGLAQAIGLPVIEGQIITVASPKPATLFGPGKVEDIASRIRMLETELVIVDHALSPVQQRNLEKAWDVKVLDRTGLILEIFGARARTREGRLQVELAHLNYQKGRLVRAWTHLERQRGGGGFVGGPGEAQIELDRRMLQTRIDAIRRDLDQVVRTRELHRAGRKKVPYPVVALVGYTNAGKSTLFNRLTGAEVLAQDQVFATLDPTMREVKLDSGRRIIMSDTVGFISELPTHLVAAFKATLEEVLSADLILHVRDIAHDETDAQAADVYAILADLGVDLEPGPGAPPIIEVLNKADLLDDDQRRELRRRRPENGDYRTVLISALTGEGIEALLATVDGEIGRDDAELQLTLRPDQGRLLSWLHENAQVLFQSTRDTGEHDLSVRIADEKKGRLLAMLEEDEQPDE